MYSTSAPASRWRLGGYGGVSLARPQARSWTVATSTTPSGFGVRARLRDAYQQLLVAVETRTAWDEDALGAAMGAIAHAAYHLGRRPATTLGALAKTTGLPYLLVFNDDRHGCSNQERGSIPPPDGGADRPHRAARARVARSGGRGAREAGEPVTKVFVVVSGRIDLARSPRWVGEDVPSFSEGCSRAERSILSGGPLPRPHPDEHPVRSDRGLAAKRCWRSFGPTPS